jgi:hypothetical protein
MGEAGAIDTTPARLEAHHENRILEDLTCGRCGYNLRGQSLDAKCPECGMIVSRSARNDLLRYSDRQWLRTVSNGFIPLMICAALALLYRFGYAYGMHHFVNAANASQSSVRWNAIVWSSMAISLVLHALTLMGVWMITHREPRADAPSHRLSRIARTFMLIAIVLMVMAWLPWVAFVSIGRSFYPAEIMYVMHIAAGCAFLVSIAALFIMARRLAFRIPDEPLARRTIIAAIGILAIMLLQYVYSWSNVLGMFFTISGEASRYIVHLPQTIVTVWAIVLLVQYRTRLRASIMSS